MKRLDELFVGRPYIAALVGLLVSLAVLFAANVWIFEDNVDDTIALAILLAFGFSNYYAGRKHERKKGDPAA